MYNITMSAFASQKTQGNATNHELRNTTKNSELQVFLGGSCNPTTWRQNLAIPFLEMNGISYYNPQIDNWTPEVVELEHRAKQDAQVLLFVIDDQTRATVTLIESAFMAGDDKNIVFVFYPFELRLTRTLGQSLEAYDLQENFRRLAGESISVEEFRELRQARSILKNLIDMRKIPTFPDIPQALNYISCHIRGTINNQKPESTSWCDNESYLSDIQRNLTEPNAHITGHNYGSQIKDVYLSLDNDDCTMVETVVIPMLKANGLSYSYMSMNSITNSQDSIGDSITDCTRNKGHFESAGLSNHRDVDEVSTRQDQSLRLLHDQSMDKAGIAIEKELYAIRTSRVLLFVITNKCRGLSIMVLASHFMALFRNNVVLCVQYLEEPCTIGGENLSKTAIADYNRGRVYLCDDAVKSRVPVFSTIREAIECCSRKCQHIK